MRITLLFVLLSGCLKTREGQDPTQCNDYLDNDGNGLTDCDELLCRDSPACISGQQSGDADSDMDADSDADGDNYETGDWNPDSGGYDTDSSQPRPGEFWGVFQFNIEFQDDLEGVEDTCTAEFNTTVDPTDSPEFSQTFLCAWNGMLETSLGNVTMTLAGSHGSSGTLESPDLDLTANWSGNSNNTYIAASFDGEATFANYAYVYDGQFDLYRSDGDP